MLDKSQIKIIKGGKFDQAIVDEVEEDALKCILNFLTKHNAMEKNKNKAGMNAITQAATILGMLVIR